MKKIKFQELSEEKKENSRRYMRKYMNKKYKCDKSFRETSHRNTNKYRNTEKGKRYVSEYNKRPEVRERVRKWRIKNRKELSRKHLEYTHKPEVALRIKKQIEERKNKKN